MIILENFGKKYITKNRIILIIRTFIYGLTFFSYSFIINCIGWSSLRLQENVQAETSLFGFIYSFKALGFFIGNIVNYISNNRLQEK
jgi:hypothetical protein